MNIQKIKLNYLIIFFSFFSCLFFLLVSLFFLFHMQAQLKNEDSIQKNNLEKSIALLIDDQIKRGDFYEAERILNRLIGVNGIEQIIIDGVNSKNRFSNKDTIQWKIDLPFNSKDQKITSATIYLNNIENKKNNLRLWFLYFLFSSFFIILNILVIYLIKKILLDPISELVENIENINPTNQNIFTDKKSLFFEFNLLWKTYIKKLLEYNDLIEVQMRSKIQNELASQVSHDIRSPLSALNLLLSQIHNIPEEQRLFFRNAVQRINDIANTLLLKSKKLNTTYEKISSDESSTNLKIELLPTIVSSLISEKRIEYSEKINIDINCELNNSYGSFVKIDKIEMARVLSNLMNNSIEAFYNFNGQLSIAIKNSLSSVSIIIKDNGKGIPENVIKEIGKKGISYGKNSNHSGSGLGLYHAIKTN